MQNFTVLYIAPADAIDKWNKKPEAERKADEATMKKDVDKWLAAHEGVVKNTIGLGVTKRISKSGVTDAKNGIMMSSYVSAESLEAATKIFKDHPHLMISDATIEIMEAIPMGK